MVHVEFALKFDSLLSSLPIHGVFNDDKDD